jgi:hypothetical protein
MCVIQSPGKVTVSPSAIQCSLPQVVSLILTNKTLQNAYVIDHPAISPTNLHINISTSSSRLFIHIDQLPGSSAISNVSIARLIYSKSRISSPADDLHVFPYPVPIMHPSELHHSQPAAHAVNLTHGHSTPRPSCSAALARRTPPQSMTTTTTWPSAPSHPCLGVVKLSPAKAHEQRQCIDTFIHITCEEHLPPGGAFPLGP